MRTLLRIATVVLVVFSAACANRDATPTMPAAEDPLQQAAAQATAIVQSAQATALVLEAQKQATALIAAAVATPTPVVRPTTMQATPTTLPGAATPPAAGDTPVAPTATVSDTLTVQVLSVVMAANGGFILVNFLAPVEVVATWYQGNVWLENEATGALYAEIGVLPVVGPLFGRPVEAGQPGYVMLVNEPQPLGPGAVVTVILGDYRFQHVRVE